MRRPSSVIRAPSCTAVTDDGRRLTDDYILAPHAPGPHPQLLHRGPHRPREVYPRRPAHRAHGRSEEHTSELQSLAYLVCRLLLEKKKKTKTLHTRQQK